MIIQFLGGPADGADLDVSSPLPAIFKVPLTDEPKWEELYHNSVVRPNTLTVVEYSQTAQHTRDGAVIYAFVR